MSSTAGRPRPSRACALVLLAAASPCGAGDADLRNWFDDPFFPVTAAIAHCPVPAGPFVTPSERQEQSHRRAEKGTTCWLAKACDRPNAYAYDADIAAAVRTAVRAGDPAFDGTSLWVTVQGRVVYVEGCVAHDGQAAAIEAALRPQPHVQQVIAIVTRDPARPNYRLRRAVR